MTQTDGQKNLSERDVQHLEYVPPEYDGIPLQDKLNVGRINRMSELVVGHTVRLLGERMPEDPDRTYSRDEVLATVAWAARRAVEGAVSYDGYSDELLPVMMVYDEDDPNYPLPFVE